MPFLWIPRIPPKDCGISHGFPAVRRSICQELGAAMALPCQAQQQRCGGAGAQAQGVQLATGTATPRGWGEFWIIFLRFYPLVI